jgi:hypothetical protein
MEISMAVDLRNGTRGVSSTAIRGAPPPGVMISSPSARKGLEWLIESSKTSILPGVTTILHSSGCRLSHRPASDQAKMDAMVFEALPEPCGTALYGVFDADCDGVIVPLGRVYIDAGGETLGNFLVSSSTFSAFSTFSTGVGRLASLPVV